MPTEGPSVFTVSPDAEGLRLDQYAGRICADQSRSFLSTLIRAGRIRIIGKSGSRPGQRVRAGDVVSVELPPPEALEYRPESMDLDILYEDTQVIVLNKPPGIVVHPGPGHSCATLVNGLLHHCTDLSPIGGKLRPGIVHRLDRDTSGTMVVAKSAMAHEHLSAQFKSRSVGKTYFALVWGHFAGAFGRIDHPIGRHPQERKKMSIHSKSPRAAETLWMVRKSYPRGMLLEVDLKTGRTHQIRVHCAAAGHPLVGDPVYGKRSVGKCSADPFEKNLRGIGRQMLHAWRLAFVHPDSGRPMVFQSPMPADMIKALRWMAGRGAKEPPTG